MSKKAILPAGLADIKNAISASVASVGATSGNDQYAGMDRYGTHYYGADRTEILDDDRWMVNLAGIQHGYTAWGSAEHGTKGQNVGEVMVPLSQPSPLESELPDVKGNWSKCVAIQMVCVDGDDKGVQILWKTNSYGGRKAYTDLMLAVHGRMEEDTAEVFPIIHLKSSYYMHKEYGKTFTPEFEIVGWSDNRSEAPEAIEESPEEPGDETPPPRRRSRKAA
jgi:hypothetical protein